NAVPPQRVQEALRGLFARWGRPLGLRLDNGLPWGGWNDLPKALALYLVGLGLELSFNPPRQPRYNGVVEKSHDTAQRWAERHTAHSVEQLQGRLDAMDLRQREAYPYVEGLSRLAIFPGLAHSGRAYSSGWEQGHWGLQAAREYLAGHVATRRVNAQGRLSLYDREYYIGTKHSGKIVQVNYDPEAGEWFVTHERLGQLPRMPAPAICPG